MENLFKNAKFGDYFKTRGGRKAIYLGSFYDDKQFPYKIAVEDAGTYGYPENGKYMEGREYLDIVSKWDEEIDEDKLADKAIESALEYSKSIDNTMTPDQEYWYQEGYKAGYRNK